MTAQDHDGNILYQEKKPLDMPIIVENTAGISPADFTGDMSDWSDAYPVYLNAPENPDQKSSWEGLDISGRMYAKWDNEYFYFIADVNDETFIQSFSKDAVWNNDSIQVSWDTDNDKASGAYQPDDYEFGFSLTSAGNEVWAYFDGQGTFGEKPSEWLKVVRDNTKKITRYYARIPLSELSDLAPSSGKKIGFNIAVNDADLTSRDEQIYLTEGTGSPIDPSKYMTCLLYTSYSYVASLYDKGLISGIGEGAFGSGAPIKRQDAAVMLYNICNYKELTLTDAREYKDFLDEADISEYAAQSIKALYEANVINGSDDGCFYPQNNITRAECCVMVNKMPGIN